MSEPVALTWERKSKYHEHAAGHNVAAVKVVRLEKTNIGVTHKTWNNRAATIPYVGGKLEWQFEVWDVRSRPHQWCGLYDTAEEARAVVARRVTDGR